LLWWCNARPVSALFLSKTNFKAQILRIQAAKLCCRVSTCVAPTSYPPHLNITSDISRALRNCGAGASSGMRTRRILQQMQGHCSHATSALFQCAPMSSDTANTPNFTACVNLCPTSAQPCGFCSEPSVVCAQVCSCRHLSCTCRPARP